MAEFITRIHGSAEDRYEVIFKTNDRGQYKSMEHFCRQLVGHLQETEPRFFLEPIHADMSEEWFDELLEEMRMP